MLLFLYLVCLWHLNFIHTKRYTYQRKAKLLQALVQLETHYTYRHLYSKEDNIFSIYLFIKDIYKCSQAYYIGTFNNAIQNTNI